MDDMHNIIELSYQGLAQLQFQDSNFKYNGSTQIKIYVGFPKPGRKDPTTKNNLLGSLTRKTTQLQQ